jgi:hypothetical protein
MDDLSLPAVFKYKNFTPNLIFGCIFIIGAWATFYALLLDAIARGTGFGYAVLLALLSLFLTAVLCIAITGSSDIIIDEQGISRRLFGKVWRTIHWDNIEIIKTFHVVAQGFRPKSVRAFTIYPTGVLFGWSYLSGGIGFSENFMNMERLIGLINLYAAKHNIKIEVQANGMRTPATHLEI